jgi:hypothetical protein
VSYVVAHCEINSQGGTEIPASAQPRAANLFNSRLQHIAKPRHGSGIASRDLAPVIVASSFIGNGVTETSLQL